MNIIIKTGLLMFLPLLLSAQVRLINNGATIKVNNGLNLRSEGGSITNQNGGLINNEGNIYLDLDFIQNTNADYTGGPMSWIWFEGSADQNAISDATLNLARLKVDNGNKLILSNSVNVSTDVNLSNNGMIELGAFDLVLSPGATISNYDAANYIITNSTGVLQQEVGASDVVFPVGNSSYNPAVLNNSGILDNFQIRVLDQVYNEGTTGAPMTSEVVNRTWLIDEEVVGGSDVAMTLQWQTADELIPFDRSNSGIAHHLSGTSWDNPAAYTAANNIAVNTWTQTRSGFSGFSPFVVRSLIAFLPVELLNFDANRRNQHQVDLDWATESETNNLGFWVERMLESETSFSEIAWVDGNHTTTNTSYYNLVDENAFSGISYYRLRQIDLDGSEAYSEIRAVRGAPKSQAIQIFPNPVDDYINIRLPELTTVADIQIYDIKGSLILTTQQEVVGNQIIQISNLSHLLDGVYIINVQLNEEDNYTERFVKRSD